MYVCVCVSLGVDDVILLFGLKWRWRSEFKFWTKLGVFYIAVILLGKGMHTTIVLPAAVNSRAD